MGKKYHLEPIHLQPDKKIYFASDFHLGAPNAEKSRQREKMICQWLEEIKADAQVVFLAGDLFDFWFEHKRVAPKGYVRFLGKLAELADSGIRLIIFQGNHDMWMRDYFTREFGAEVYREPREYQVGNKRMLVGHGDGLGPGDRTYKFMKAVFENRLCRWLFRKLLHPDFSLWLGYTWAANSWKNHDKEQDYDSFIAKEKELLYLYCLEEEQKEHHDYYIFGHRHQKLDIVLNQHSRYINLGDWIRFYSYAVFDGKELQLRDFSA